MKKQNSISERFRLLEAIIWMNSLGLIIHIIAGLYCLGKKPSADPKEICIDELELNLIRLFVLVGSVLILLFCLNYSKWMIIIGIILLLLSLLGVLKRKTVHLLNDFHNE